MRSRVASTPIRVRTWWSTALALALSIGIAAPASAQVRPDSTGRGDTVRVAVPVPAPDSARNDSLMQARILARTDSIRNAVLADSLKAPVARFQMPASFEIGERLRFVGDQILQTGATNLADILDRVPGVTTYRSGWLAGVHAASYNGDASRIRLVLDGVELDPIEPRNGTAIDLTDVQLWSLDELVILTWAWDPLVQRRSYELLAQAFELA